MANYSDLFPPLVTPKNVILCTVRESSRNTLRETNTSPLKMGTPWKRRFRTWKNHHYKGGMTIPKYKEWIDPGTCRYASIRWILWILKNAPASPLPSPGDWPMTLPSLQAKSPGGLTGCVAMDRPMTCKWLITMVRKSP